jgi:hypothetical protein
MTQLPRSARLYVSAVIAGGGLIFVESLLHATFPAPRLFVALLAASVLTSIVKVDFPLGIGGASLSLSYPIVFVALLLLGPEPTVLIAATSAWSQCTFRMKERNPIYKTLFSMASLATAVAMAGVVHHSFEGAGYGRSIPAQLQPLLAAAMTYFFINTLAVAAAFALATRQSIFRVWHDDFLWSATSYLVGQW